MTNRRFGDRLQREIEGIELGAARRPFGSALLGIALALAVVLGGTVVFVVVFIVLVGILH